MTPAAFAALHPRLYHVAWPEARARIRREGLLSPLALCKALELSAAETEDVLSTRRPDITPLAADVILNDDSPLNDKVLRRALPPDLSPTAWRRILNSRVFLFATKQAAREFANVRAARERARDVWVFDTRSFAEAFWGRMEITPINTGAASRRAPQRDRSIFAPLNGLDYGAWQRRRPVKTPDRIREVCVRHSAPEAARFTVDLIEMPPGAKS